MSTRHILVGVMVCVAIALTGCRSDQPADANDTKTAAENMKEEAGEALEATGDYLAQQKERFMKSSRETLDGLKADYAELKEQLADKSDEAREAAGRLTDKLDDQLAKAEQSLQEASEATADKWDTVKEASGEGLSKARQTYDELVDYLASEKQSSEAQNP